MPPRRSRPAILSPAYWHPPAAGRAGNKLLNGPVSWRPGVIPVRAFTRPLQGIPLTGGQGTSVVSAGPVAGAAIVQGPVVVGGALSGALPNPTKAGNCVVVIINAFNTTSGNVPSVSGVTLGGSADHFTAGSTGVSAFVGTPAYALASVWVDFNCAGGQTAIAVSGSNLSVGSGFGLILYEVSGVLTSSPVDQQSSAGAPVSGTAWSSGSTPATTSPNEIWFAADTLAVGTQPGAPWISTEYTSSGTGGAYQIVTSTGSALFAGTQSPAGTWAAAVVTLKTAAPVSAPPAGSALISVGPQGLGNIWYPAQVTISTTSGVNDTSTCQVFLGPAGVPVTLLGTIFPGGIGTLGAAVPPLAPGQYLIAQWTGGNPGDVAAINVIGTMDSIMPG